ncbi:MAG: sel1 repeat family protein [Deltaproteobacteria bacterium]|jgi:TPR repeat protein|nr:sel1 repeat family protein [Deltaproteobacteria bacterium]
MNRPSVLAPAPRPGGASRAPLFGILWKILLFSALLAFSFPAFAQAPADGAATAVLTADEWSALAAKAEKGNPEAEYQAGLIYFNGLGVPADPELGLSYLAKAADHGVVASQSFLGFLYERGVGVPQDYQRALTYYGKAARKDDPLALMGLAGIYFYGNGAPVDYKKAFGFFSRAAKKGEALAQIMLGEMHEKGLGTAPNPQKAFASYLLAADNPADDGYALFIVAELYASGANPAAPKDEAKAQEYYRRAADKGFAGAAERLTRP